MSSDLISIAAFLRRNIPCLGRMRVCRQNRENLLVLIAWHIGNKSLCSVKEGRFQAVGMARPVHTVADAGIPYKHDERGKILYLEHVAAKNIQAVRTLFHFVRMRWPGCTHVMFRRTKTTERYRLYPMKPFMRKFGVLC